ncbi:MAG: hypothetical protein AAGG01_19050, partial [Planctomycetota bacterium]
AVYHDSVVRLLERQLKGAGVHVISVHRTPAMDQYQLYAPCGPGRHHHLCVDLHVAETCYGMPFQWAESLVRGRKTDRRPHRPAPVPGAVLNFLTPYLPGGVVHPEYLARASVVLEQYPAQMRAHIGELVGTRMADRFCKALRSPSTSDLHQCHRAFRRALIVRAFGRHPLPVVRGLLHLVWSSRIAARFRTRGLTIAMLGADGTGKTSVGDELHAELRSSFRSAWNRTIKLRPGLFPQLGRLLGRRPTAEEFSRPHRARPSGSLMTWVRATYYWLDYTIGYAIKVVPLRRRNTLILFDRWIDDWLVDPARYRFREGSRYVAWLVDHAPRPDVILVTTASQRLVRSRKQEVDARETLRQLTAYEAYANTRENAFIVDTSISLDRSVDAAVLAVMTRSQGFLPGRHTGPLNQVSPVSQGMDASSELPRARHGAAA